jgi:hypothetical protein
MPKGLRVPNFGADEPLEVRPSPQFAVAWLTMAFLKTIKQLRSRLVCSVSDSGTQNTILRFDGWPNGGRWPGPPIMPLRSHCVFCFVSACFGLARINPSSRISAKNRCLRLSLSLVWRPLRYSGYDGAAPNE